MCCISMFFYGLVCYLLGYNMQDDLVYMTGAFSCVVALMISLALDILGKLKTEDDEFTFIFGITSFLSLTWFGVFSFTGDRNLITAGFCSIISVIISFALLFKLPKSSDTNEKDKTE